MNTYLVISALDHQIIEAETEQKALVESLTRESDLSHIGASKENIRQELIFNGFKSMKGTSIINIYQLI